MESKYTEDDYCDLYPKKICDNCGKCLEEQGIDTKAINIEDISVNVKENEEALKKYKKTLENKNKDYDKKDLSDLEKIEESDFIDNSLEEVSDFKDENLEKLYEDYNDVLSSVDGLAKDDEYEDAFDHIEYVEDLELDDLNMEELTEEVFPGVRKLKNSK
ncbi:hypothetical protein [Clostridium fallax]|uniref:Uncharacterized protein n=1 Tax=Clostridium fallax TaxID=1533 RepID=A0A1M4Z9G6_9CLOT|nr:hypothetical protein [Clostridium fallax]SHF14713.1 hypothetical protein SAMN05443638_1407 [Clostridium fallax]SQB06436.1 protein containing Zn-finger domain [Clostridium fallax]